MGLDVPEDKAQQMNLHFTRSFYYIRVSAHEGLKVPRLRLSWELGFHLQDWVPRVLYF